MAISSLYKSIVFFVLGMFFFPAYVFSLSYNIIDIGTLGGSESWPAQINDTGSVVGMARDGANQQNSFLYENGSIQKLGTLAGKSNSYASDINITGLVVGNSFNSSSDYEAYIYQNGSMTAIGTLGGRSYALGVNDSGNIVGWSDTGGSSHAFLYNGTEMVDLGTFGETRSSAYGINNNNQVIINSRSGSFGWDKTILYDYDTGNYQDIGSLGGNSGQADGINDNGYVVGGSTTASGGYHAYLYDGMGMSDLGTLGGILSHAYDVNNDGQIVGYYEMANGVRNAFFHDGTNMYDLRDLVVGNESWDSLSLAVAINNMGQIVGHGTIGGQNHAFLLNPMTTPVPEPTTMILLFTGLLGLAGVRHRMKS